MSILSLTHSPLTGSLTHSAHSLPVSPHTEEDSETDYSEDEVVEKLGVGGDEAATAADADKGKGASVSEAGGAQQLQQQAGKEQERAVVEERERDEGILGFD